MTGPEEAVFWRLLGPDQFQHMVQVMRQPWRPKPLPDIEDCARRVMDHVVSWEVVVAEPPASPVRFNAWALVGRLVFLGVGVAIGWWLCWIM